MNFVRTPYYFKRLKGGKVILSNMLRDFIIIDNSEFDVFVEDPGMLEEDVLIKLKSKNFIYENEDILLEKASDMYLETKINLFDSTFLHIFVVTIDCNLNCLYCQAAKGIYQDKRCIMSKEVAEKAVDIALQSPREKLTFELQGGEPLLNFDVIKHIIDYTNEKNKLLNKDIHYTIVTNTQAMTADKMDYLISNKVGLCFSLDGPKYIHDYNRPSLDGKSNFEEVKRWILYCKKRDIKVGLLPTTTRKSLNSYKEIVDSYVEFGARSISIRELSPYGRGNDNFAQIGYTAEEFINFYKNVVEYIFELNGKGLQFKENFTYMYLKFILTKQSLIYPDHKSPCGGTIGQMAYNWNGDIFTCDEGRMVANSGDNTFRTGNVFSSSYKDCLDSQATVNTVSSSCIDCHYICKDCVFNPICGVCPVYNYNQDGNLIGRVNKNDRCKILKGIYTYILSILEKNDDKSHILKSWLEYE